MLKKLFENIEQLEEASIHGNKDFIDFVEMNELIVEEHLREKLSYSGDLVWDRFFSQGFQIRESPYLYYFHYIVDEDKYANSNLFLNDDTSFKYLKTNITNNNKTNDSLVLDKLNSKIQLMQTAEEKMKFYLNLFYDKRSFLKKEIESQSCGNKFQIFDNYLFENILVNAAKEVIDNSISRITLKYDSYIQYNPNNDEVDIRFYFTKDRLNSFKHLGEIKLKLDEDINYVKIELKEKT